jgi:hypothetical protein
VRRVVVSACILHVIACDDVASHVYQGRLYREDRGCVATTSAVDVVEGADPGSCAPVCLVGKEDGTRVVYASTMCAPYPKFFDTSGADPACALALAAFTRGDTCFADGGSAHPEPRDAGTD